MFEGFDERRIEGAGAEIFARIGGAETGPPLVLLHGYPQTSAMWEHIAPVLAETYRVICPDLRGYGRSAKPGAAHPGADPTHALYSKRAMAADIAAVMTRLGHDRFFVAAHDRGARVAHRLGLDHADRVAALSVLDIAPTREMYARTDDAFARAYWHWFYLIQPYPLPEQMIGADPEAYWRHKCINLGGGTHPFSPSALAEYIAAFKDPAVIHASCEDYRAAASIDIDHDNADGDPKLTMPVQAIWGARGVIARCFDALALWRARAETVEGQSLDGGHYLAEECPDALLPLYRDFFGRHSV